MPLYWPVDVVPPKVLLTDRGVFLHPDFDTDFFHSSDLNPTRPVAYLEHEELFAGVPGADIMFGPADITPDVDRRVRRDYLARGGGDSSLLLARNLGHAFALLYRLRHELSPVHVVDLQTGQVLTNQPGSPVRDALHVLPQDIQHGLVEHWWFRVRRLLPELERLFPGRLALLPPYIVEDFQGRRLRRDQAPRQAGYRPYPSPFRDHRGRMAVRDRVRREQALRHDPLDTRRYDVLPAVNVQPFVTPPPMVDMDQEVPTPSPGPWVPLPPPMQAAYDQQLRFDRALQVLPSLVAPTSNLLR